MQAAIILQLLLQYGPSAVTLIQNLVNKLEAGDTVTLADVEAQFSGMQPYASYSIRQAGTAEPPPASTFTQPPVVSQTTLATTAAMPAA